MNVIRFQFLMGFLYLVICCAIYVISKDLLICSGILLIVGIVFIISGFVDLIDERNFR